MSASPEPSTPSAPPAPPAAPAIDLTLNMTPEAGIVPSPPTPSPEPTSGPLPLSGRGHPVESVEIIGHPVEQSGWIGTHLAEVIRYRDGTKPDIVGYDPEGKGFLHGGDPLYAETSLGGKTPEEYVAASTRYYLKIEATPHQTLDQFVAHQEHAWKMYDRSKAVPRYDPFGNDVAFNNSNGALVSSIREAGRGDIADRIQHEVEPPERIRALQQEYSIANEAAGLRLGLERLSAGQPVVPGASHELTRAQVEGLATPDPANRALGLAGRQGDGVRDAALSFGSDARRDVERAIDMLENVAGRDGQYLTVMRTDSHGAQSLQHMREPFAIHGTIVSADTERVTQNIGRGETFTYKTEDLLKASQDRDGALRLLEYAAANHELTSIKVGNRGLDVTTQSMEQGRGYEHSR